MKKIFALSLGALLCACSIVGCGGNEGDSTSTSSSNGGNDNTGGVPPIVTSKLAEIAPTVYDVDEIVEASQTEAGDAIKWQAEVFTKNGGNNDEVTKNAIIHSPWHTLTINDTEVPVYTARCGKGSHSFAWVDVTSNKKDFMLDVKLDVSLDDGRQFKQCQVLPQSREVATEITAQTVKSVISDYGSFTYTFSASSSAKVTDPTLAPLTIMVTEEEELDIPSDRDVRYIEPGYHETDELEFTDVEMYYVFKPGLHEISSINIPDNSVLWLERGAYLKCTDRLNADGSQNRNTAIHSDDTEKPEIRGRGLLDMGEVKGGDGKFKHVVNYSRVTDGVIDGLTIINSNTWTMCIYNSDNVTLERNLLLGYRTYSDGICMSECVDSVGRYNFVRTGDDAIEFKGHGWGGHRVGSNCTYEYNDLWTDKGSGYCLTWESDCDMENMYFRNNSVGFGQPTWSAGNNVLDVRLGTNANKRWGDVTFENIEIYHVISPNVCITQVSGKGAYIDNILFKNIDVYSTEFGTFAYTMSSSMAGRITDIQIENFNFCGKKLTSADKDNSTIINFEGSVDKAELTIK